MNRTYRGLNFEWHLSPPEYPVVYLAVRNGIVEYVGQAENGDVRTSDKDHEGLMRVSARGGYLLLFSGCIPREQDRRDVETLIRRDLQPLANNEPTPTWETSAKAAERLGWMDVASEYRKRAIAQLLVNQPRRLTPYDLPQKRSAFFGMPQTPPSPPMNAFAAALANIGNLKQK
ncbi:MAG: hypothetical protein NXH88_01780 [Hyphomonas sp.]|nr:hypothetical protein [Hyphomonas sp.]